MGEANLGRPFLNEAIIDVLKEWYFQGRKSLHRLFPAEFPQSLAADNGGKGPEMPPRLVALVATFVWSMSDLYMLGISCSFRSITASWKVVNLPKVGSTKRSTRFTRATLLNSTRYRGITRNVTTSSWIDYSPSVCTYGLFYFIPSSFMHILGGIQIPHPPNKPSRKTTTETLTRRISKARSYTAFHISTFLLYVPYFQ